MQDNSMLEIPPLPESEGIQPVASNLLEYQAQQQKALGGVIACIRKPLDLETIFQTTAVEVRQQLKADRVGIFRFYPEQDWEGEFIAEDVDSEWSSTLTARICDHCFSERFVALYQQGRVNAIADIERADLSECDRQILKQFQVRAQIVAPLLKGEDLWGLLCIHQCSNARDWQASESEFVQQIAEHLGVALQHSELLEQARFQAQQQKALAGVIARIRKTLNLDTLFKTTALEVRQLLKADRVAVFRFHPEQNWEGEFVSEDVDSEWTSVLAAKVYDHCFGERFAPLYHQGRVQAVADIHSADLSDCHRELLGCFQVRANLVVPLLKEQALWGLLCIHQCGAPRHWQASEIEFVQQIAEHLGVALQQAEYLKQVQNQAEQQKALTGVITRIRKSLDLDTIFKITAFEVRQLLKANRVAVLRFYPERDWEGKFISEDTDSEWFSVLATKVYDHCFGERFAPLYHQGRVQAIADIDDAGLSDCHREILGRFQVRANLVVPLLKEQTLWGLLCIHQCDAPRYWQASEIEFVQQIAEHLGVALQQAEYLEQVQTQSAQLAKAAERDRAAEQQKALAATVDKIRQSLDLDTIFCTTAQEVRRLLQADRVTMYRFNPDWSGDFVAESVAKGWTPLVGVHPTITDTHLQETQGGRYRYNQSFAINDIYQAGHTDCHVALLEEFQARAYAIAPILQGDQLWGLLSAFQNSGPRQWQTHEVDLLAQIGTQMGIALKLASARVREKALAQTVDKIRQSLEIDTIFQTTTYEVRQLLQADRVAMYRFNPDWSGDFVAESVAEGWTPLLGVQPTIADTHLQETQGGRYRRNETFAVNDIYQAGHTDCHVELLEEFQARAYAIAPILQRDQLWGLLVAFQNSGPRQWQTEEIYLLTQIGNQLGIALQQAVYLQQVQTQATQLAKAAERQRALATTVEKIRQSLDIDEIFQTTTQEVRQLLEVERVAIYRFYPNWSGRFVADSIVSGWTPLTTPQSPLETVFSQASSTGEYPRNETFVPILQGEKLWGLLVAYQNSQPRYWTDEEINLLAQVGVQLGVALQQAELLKQTRQQAEELTQTLRELQQSQTQLIQGEKMASLGQLVAGVAHEINNPVNFIFGNLNHVSDYTQNLLSMVSLYQEHHPNPASAIQEQAQAVDLEFITEDLPKTLASMKMGVDRIRQIVSSLRTFSRLNEAEKKPVNLHEGIDSTLLILQHRLKAKSDFPAIKVVKEYGDLPLVACYAAQLNQVFMNILSNAIDALEESSEVFVGSSKLKTRNIESINQTQNAKRQTFLFPACGFVQKL